MNPIEYLTPDKVDYMKKIALRLCRDKFLAEDIVQDCCLHLLKRNSQYVSEKATIKNFLHHVVRNRYITYYRKNKYNFVEVEPEHSYYYPSIDHEIDIEKCFQLIKRKYENKKLNDLYLKYAENKSLSDFSNNKKYFDYIFRDIKNCISFSDKKEIKGVLNDN